MPPDPAGGEDPRRPDGGTAGGSTTGRRLLAYTVVVCLAGAGLALYGGTRVWSVVVTARPGLPDLRAARTGAQVLPWLPALALVGLAGAGALLATRGRARRILGALLALVGAGIAVGAVAGRAGLDPGAAGGRGVVWPAACVLGGALVAVGGWWAARQGHRWPSMGARYERRAGGAAGAPDEKSRAADQSREAEQSRAADQSRETGPVDTRAAWDALDRGDDPTLR